MSPDKSNGRVERLLRFKKAHFHWGTLRTLGNSRLVSTSFVWLFVVPVAAKLLAPFAGEHTLDVSWIEPERSEPLIFTVALPFSWKRFYLMSWFFVIGQGVYWFACPEIVRKYTNYGDYHRDHASSSLLREFLDRALQRGRDDDEAHRRFIEISYASTQSPMTTERVKNAARTILQVTEPAEYSGARQNLVFDGILGIELHARPICIWISAVFFTAGLVLFTWVVIEGVAAVLKLL